jgi:hypothetical protein
MKNNRIGRIGLIALAAAALGASALAGGRNPGSLLLYPEFDNRAGVVTIFTVTNVNTADDAVDVLTEIVYVGKYNQAGANLNCAEFNREILLTPGDTFTFLTKAHNPNQAQGYAFLFAKAGTGPTAPIVYNWLTGNAMTVDGLTSFEYAVNPVSYAGIGNGIITDLDGDGHKDMNGCEYEANPDTLLFPRFMGQGGVINSDLILIGLSGGTQFDTTVDFLIFNDNEEVFSSEHTFRCWERVPLLEISGIFGQEFLKNYTNHDPNEIFGASFLESGWFKLWGAVANSSATTIQFPSVYAVLIEKTGVDRGASDLPFEVGVRTNGELLPRIPQGDLVDVTCR